LSSCDAKEVVSPREAAAIYYRGGEVVGIVRESVSRKMQIAHDGGVEKLSEKGCAFLWARVICVHLFCVVAMANVSSSDLCHHGAQDSESDCSFRFLHGEEEENAMPSNSWLSCVEVREIARSKASGCNSCSLSGVVVCGSVTWIATASG
jgi:hypothetical protein